MQLLTQFRWYDQIEIPVATLVSKIETQIHWFRSTQRPNAVSLSFIVVVYNYEICKHDDLYSQDGYDVRSSIYRKREFCRKHLTNMS